MKFCLAITLCTIRFICPAYAQQPGLTISGKISSADDHQPVPSANISIAQKGIGTATNDSGNFMLIIPTANLHDSLRISCLGFKSRSVPIANLQDNQTLAINLVKTSIELKEVKIEFRDPMKIIQKAIDRIPNNYITGQHVTKGFYRNVTTSGKKYLQLSEAVFDIYNYAFADKKDDLFRLIKARDEKNQRDFGSIELGRSPKSVFETDKVRNIENSDVFSKDGIKRHSFEVAGIVDYKGYQAYEITFAEKPGIKEKGYRGKVYIDTKNFAFLCFDYGLSPDSYEHFKFGDFATRMLMKMVGLTIDLKYDHCKVNYQQVNGKWVLSDVAEDNRLYIKGSQRKYNMNADIKFNYQVTAIDTAKVAPFDTRLSKGTLIEDHDSSDDNFWKDYNIVLPNFNTEQVIAEIRAVNEIVNLKKKFIEKLRKLPKDPAQRLDSLLAFYNTNGQFNGTALITAKGKVLLSKSYGFANKEKRQVANEHTTYRIGSTAKTFTSVIINQLANEGKLDIHTPIKTYLPWYAHGDITLEQLLTHQSGIPEYFDNPDHKLQIVTKSFTLKEMVQMFCSDSLEFKPGTDFHYSNSNFTILALIAQEVSSKPFETLLQECIFTPLQMTDTYVGEYKGTGSHQAVGYSDGKPEIHYNPANTMGAGGISSSAADMLKYHDALMTEKLLPKNKMAEMLKPRVEFLDYNAWYDYGWMTDKSAFGVSGNKHVITYHPGTDVGFFTMFTRQEDTNNCIIMLNNTGDFPRYDMTDLILDILN
jgi:CubicO group peptidase (beta-lactamase class C family)